MQASIESWQQKRLAILNIIDSGTAYQQELPVFKDIPVRASERPQGKRLDTSARPERSPIQKRFMSPNGDLFFSTSLNPSLIEIILRHILHNKSDEIFIPEKPSGDSEQIKFYMELGKVMHELAKMCADAVFNLIDKGEIYELIGFPEDSEFIPTEFTVHNSLNPLSQSIGAYMPRLSDGISFTKIRAILETLPLTEQEVLIRMRVFRDFRHYLTSLIPESISDDPQQSISDSTWAKLRDYIHENLDLFVAKMEMVITELQRLQGSYAEVGVMALETNVISHILLKGPSTFDTLNREEQKDYQKLMMPSDILLFRVNQYSRNTKVLIEIEIQHKRVEGVIEVGDGGVPNIPEQLRPYVVGIDINANVVTDLRASEHFVHTLVVTPNISAYLRRMDLLSEVVQSRDGHRLGEANTSATVFESDSKHSYLFSDIKVDALGIQLLTKTDAAFYMLNESARFDDAEIHIVDYKSSYFGLHDLTETTQVAMYMLNVAIQVYMGKIHTSTGKPVINPQYIDILDTEVWSKLAHIIDRIKFFYFDLKTGNKVRYDVNSDTVYAIVTRVLKFIVGMKMIYPNTLKELIELYQNYQTD